MDAVGAINLCLENLGIDPTEFNIEKTEVEVGATVTMGGAFSVLTGGDTDSKKLYQKCLEQKIALSNAIETTYSCDIISPIIGGVPTVDHIIDFTDKGNSNLMFGATGNKITLTDDGEDERKIVFYDATKQTFRKDEVSDVPIGDYFLVNGNTSIFLLKSAIDTAVIESRQGYDRYEGSGGGKTTTPWNGYIDANIKYGILYSLFVQDGVVQVRANKNVVKEISLQPFLEEVIAKCAQPPDAFYPPEANYDETSASISVSPNFIEDENYWAFTVDCFCEKSCSISYEFPDGETAYAIAPIEGTEGYTHAEEEFSVRISSVSGVEYSPPSFLLDDGYHYSKKPFVIPSDDESRVLADVTFFSPSGAQIFSGMFNYNLYVLSLRRIHNGYLLGVDSGTNLTGMFAANSTPYPLPKPYLLSGLFLLQGGECSGLSDWGLC